jgi:hypothetical protein
MASFPTSDHDENMDTSADGASNVTQPGLTPQEGQSLQGITDSQMQPNATSQRQDEPQGQQER